MIDVFFEVDDFFNRRPVFVPAPGIELGLAAGAQMHVAFPAGEAQQIPNLLLAAVGAAPLAAHPVAGHVVAQPVAGAAEDFHMVRQQADFFQ